MMVTKKAPPKKTLSAKNKPLKKLVKSSKVTKPAKTSASPDVTLYSSLSKRLKEIRSRLLLISQRKARYSDQKQAEYKKANEQCEKLASMLSSCKSDLSGLRGLLHGFREVGKLTSVLRRAYNAAAKAPAVKKKASTVKKKIGSTAKKSAPKKKATVKKAAAKALAATKKKASPVAKKAVIKKKAVTKPAKALLKKKKASVKRGALVNKKSTGSAS